MTILIIKIDLPTVPNLQGNGSTLVRLRVIFEDEQGYHFQYDRDYLKKENVQAISLTLPLQEKTFHERVLFPFFDGLIPEEWLMEIAVENWKVNPRNVVLTRKNQKTFTDRTMSIEEK